MELFKLFGTILVDNEKANKSIHQSEEKAESFSQKLSRGIGTVGKWGAAIVASAAAVGGAMLGMANSSASAMDEIDKMSAKIGISKKGFQEWRYVLGQNGMEIDKMQVGMKTLVNKMDAVSSGNKNAQESFDKLGISVYDTSGKLKDQETMMKETMYALADMENGTEKAKLATELFGKAGIEMMPMLNNGSKGMKELTKRAHELGLVVSDEAVTSGVVFGDTMDDLKQAFGMVSISIGNRLIPMFQTMADWILEHMPQIRGAIKKVSDFVGSAVNFVISVLKSFSPVFEGVMSAIKSFWNDYGKVVFDSLIEIVEMIYQQWLVIMPAVQNLFSSFMNIIKVAWESVGKPVFDFIIEIVKTVSDIFMQYFPMIADIVSNVFNLISNYWNTILSPIIQMIGNMITTYLLPIFKESFNKISNVVKIAFDFIANLWNNTLKPVLNGIITFVRGVFSGDWQSAWNGVKTIVSNVWNGIKSAIERPLTSAKNFVKKIIDTIKGFFNFKISWPKIPLPHFKIKPKGWDIGDLLKGKIPTLGIDWYAEGGILTKPTAFGINPANGNLRVGGEAGDEAVAPIETLLDYIRTAVSESNQGIYEALKNILLLMSDYFPQFANVQIVLDTGVLAAHLAPKVDEEMGKIEFRKGR